MNATARMRTTVPPKAKMIPCDTCEGTKLEGRTYCPECGGSGYMPEVRLEWRVRGDDCRTARLSIHATLSEASFYTGIPMVDIAGMEAGLIDPARLERHWFRG
jgi:hypothetical protein